MTRRRRPPVFTRRLLAAGLLLAPAAAMRAAASGASPAADSPTIDVWVHLSLPELSAVPAADRDAARRRLADQQDSVMRALRELGAVEQARVQLVRNALAVRLPRTALEQARHIPGVRTVTPVRHRDLHRP